MEQASIPRAVLISDLPMKFCDLHTHSCFSDGTCTPAEIIALACNIGLSAVALTDHNTLEGLSDFLSAANGQDILAIPGVEISTGYQGKELHIVGLYLNPLQFESVSVFLEEINRRKEISNRNLVQALCQAGYTLDYDEIRRRHPEGTVNRAVIAAALLEKGFVSSVKEAFQNLLSAKGPYFVPPERICCFEAIAFLKSIQAVPILAHPFLNLTEAELRKFLPEAKKHGLVAIETMYSSYSPETAALAADIALEFDLLPSGGSDFHGDNKPDISLGIGKENLQIPCAFAEQLQNSL